MKLLKRPKPQQQPRNAVARLCKDGSTKLVLPKKPRKLPASNRAIREQAELRNIEIEAKAASRRKYAAERGLPAHDARKNLARLDEYAKVQVVTYPNGKVKEIPVITPTALGEPLDTTGVTVTRWLKADMLPAPALRTSRGGLAYHLEEARSFIRIIGEHQQHFRQYRKEHTDVKDRLFRENALLRSNLFNVK